MPPLHNLVKPMLPRLARAPGAWRDYFSRMRSVAARVRHDWLRIIGAPDYAAYLEHHRAHHAGTPPMSEREYVCWFIERRYNKPGGGSRCC